MPSARAASLNGSSRRPGIDVLRATATLFVVLLHAAIPYTVAPMPGLTWPVRHAVVSPVIDTLFWGIEGAIMPLFFFLSGYGAAQTLAGKPGEFLASRWKRLGWPLLAAAAVLLPLELYIWLIGWAADGQIPWQKLRSLKLNEYHQHLWGLSHLWYLEYLLIYSAGLWVVSPRGPAEAVGGQIKPFLAIGSSPLLSTVRNRVQKLFNGSPLLNTVGFAAVILWFTPEVVVGFQHGFLPFPAKFAFSGLFFAWGVREFRQPSLDGSRASWAVLPAACLVLSFMPLLHRQVAAPLVGTDRLLLSSILAVYAVMVVRAAWQAALTIRWPGNPGWQYLAKASFWVYLVHHPLVAIWQIVLRSTGWTAVVQFGLVTLGTLALSLGSYEWIVRRSWLGEFLEGRRSAVAPVPQTVPIPVEVPARRAA